MNPGRKPCLRFTPNSFSRPSFNLNSSLMRFFVSPVYLSPPVHSVGAPYAQYAFSLFQQYVRIFLALPASAASPRIIFPQIFTRARCVIRFTHPSCAFFCITSNFLKFDFHSAPRLSPLFHLVSLRPPLFPACSEINP